MDCIALALPLGDKRFPRLDRLLREILYLKPSKRRGIHRYRKDCVTRPANGSKRIAFGIKLALALGIQDLHSQTHGIDNMGEAPEIPQRAMRPPKADVIRPDVPVFHENGADSRECKISGASPRRDIEIYGDAAIRLVHQLVHQHRLARERKRSGRMHGIELEVVYTKIAVERQQEVRVLVPVCRVIGRIGSKPKPKLHALRTRFSNYIPKTVWKPDRVDVPESFHFPP